MRKKIFGVVLTLLLSIVSINGVQAANYNWHEFLANNVINKQTPVTKDTISLSWLQNFLNGQLYAYNTNPIIEDGYVYIAVDNTLYKLDSNSGNILASTTLEASIGYNAYLASGSQMIFVALGNGKIQAFDSQNLNSLWLSIAQDGNLVSPLTYYNGYLYTGTTIYDDNYNVVGGKYFALEVSDEDISLPNEEKTNSWEYDLQQGGYYWSKSSVINDHLVFVSTKGTLVSKDLTSGKETALNLDNNQTLIYSGVCYGDGSLYIGSKTGKIYQVTLDENGGFDTYQTITVLQGTASITGTPVYYNNTLYFGGQIGSNFDAPGFIAKMDTNTHQINTIETLANVQSSILLTAGYDEAIYGYYTVNNYPGGINVFKDTGDSFTSEMIYEPQDNYQNYTTASVISDGQKLYYTNDSATLFALEKNEIVVKVPEPVEDVPAVETTNNDKTTTAVKTGDDQITGVLYMMIISAGAYFLIKKYA